MSEQFNIKIKGLTMAQRSQRIPNFYEAQHYFRTYQEFHLVDVCIEHWQIESGVDDPEFHPDEMPIKTLKHLPKYIIIKAIEDNIIPLSFLVRPNQDKQYSDYLLDMFSSDQELVDIITAKITLNNQLCGESDEGRVLLLRNGADTFTHFVDHQNFSESLIEDAIVKQHIETIRFILHKAQAGSPAIYKLDYASIAESAMYQKSLPTMEVITDVPGVELQVLPYVISIKEDNHYYGSNPEPSARIALILKLLTRINPDVQDISPDLLQKTLDIISDDAEKICAKHLYHPEENAHERFTPNLMNCLEILERFNQSNPNPSIQLCIDRAFSSVIKVALTTFDINLVNRIIGNGHAIGEFIFDESTIGVLKKDGAQKFLEDLISLGMNPTIAVLNSQELTRGLMMDLASKENLKLFELLVSYLDDIDYRNLDETEVYNEGPTQSLTLLQNIITDSEIPSWAAIIDILVLNRATPTIVDSKGNTLLHLAYSVEVVDCCVKLKLDPDQENYQKLPPLFKLLQEGYIPEGDVNLFTALINVNAKYVNSEGRPFIHFIRNVKQLDYFIGAGFNHRALDNEGKSLLDVLC